jgi:putative flippase GtrA
MPHEIQIIIPAYKPNLRLISLVRVLSKNYGLIIIDDGSGKSYQEIFNNCKKYTNVKILTHATNMGKGQALKTGFNHYLNTYSDGLGVVTADADGQHSAYDINKIAKKITGNSNSIYLGSRSFNASIPARSRFGNILTRYIFRLFTGVEIKDTQTGLRGIPYKYLNDCLKIQSNGYDYELEMLLSFSRKRVQLIEIMIQTIYEPGNPTSHFNPIVDSLKIYFIFLRFISVSIVTAIIDYLIFILGYLVFNNVLPSLILGRFFAGTFNFVGSRNFVFHSKNKVKQELPSYILTVIIITTLSFLGINILTQSLSWGVIAAKLAVESVMFSLSFLAMKLIVFKMRVRHLNHQQKMSEKKTDWDLYYRNPTSSAKFTRKFTESLILKLFDKYYTNQKKAPFITELGGGGSCLFKAIRKVYPFSKYTIIDNNQFGLEAFKSLYPSEANISLLNVNLENLHKLPCSLSDITFSVGLIEHFDKKGTSRVISRHFDATKTGGIVIITFPTPTWLYIIVRKLAEWSGVWVFHDERPLGFDEVRESLILHGEILYECINWPIILTQGVIVTRKYKTLR